MSNTHPTKPPDRLLDPEAFATFQVRNAREIRRILHQIARRHLILTAYIDGGPMTFVTTVLDLTHDGEGVILDSSREENIMARIERGSSLVCSGVMDGVRLEFEVADPAGFPYDGFEAIRADLPEMLLRLQRRESFRMPIPLSNELACKLHFPDEDEHILTKAVRVLDLSAEGIGVLLADEALPLKAGQTLTSSMFIPDVGDVHLELQLRNTFQLNTRSGKVTMRAGFKMLDPSPRIMNAIQRFLFKIERERKLLEPDH